MWTTIRGRSGGPRCSGVLDSLGGGSGAAARHLRRHGAGAARIRRDRDDRGVVDEAGAAGPEPDRPLLPGRRPDRRAARAAGRRRAAARGVDRGHRQPVRRGRHRPGPHRRRPAAAGPGRRRPAGWLGAGAAGRFTPGDTGMLVKLLDAGQRLPVHVHPDRAFARSHLQCPYGKTEAWLVLDADPGSAVYLGWRDDVDPDELAARRDAQDGAWMLARMHRIEVRRGDGILVPAGTVHAIGEGVFVLEAQEPTDFSILLEWSVTTETRDGSHLGLGLRHRDGRGRPPPAGPGPAARAGRPRRPRRARPGALPGRSRPSRSSGSTCSSAGVAGAGRVRRAGRPRRRRRAAGRRRARSSWAPGRPGRCRPGSATGRSPARPACWLARPGRDWPADLVAGGAPDDRSHVVGLDVGSTYLKALLLTARRRAGRRGPPAHAVAQPARRPHRDGRGRAARRGRRDLLAELAATAGAAGPATCAASASPGWPRRAR